MRSKVSPKAVFDVQLVVCVQPRVIRKTGTDSKGKAGGMNTLCERMSDKYILISVFTKANGNNDASAISG